MAGESPVMELAEAERDHSGALTKAGWITTIKSKKKLIIAVKHSFILLHVANVCPMFSFSGVLLAPLAAWSSSQFKARGSAGDSYSPLSVVAE